jgi:molybdate transport system substrate-binding protein
MRSRAAVGLALLLALPRPARAEELLVFAASSLTDALREIGRDYEARAGGTVVFNFGASSDLARQIQAGAPADVFFSADRAQVDSLERAGLVRAADRTDALSNTLVVIVSAASGVAVKQPADLLGLRLLALADPEAVPAGVYARKWLESLALWDALRARVVPTLDARAAVAAVASQSAAAGIVYKTDALASARVKVAYEVPPGEGPRIAYCLAPLAASGRAGARDLARYLISSPARDVYRRLGFIVIAPE